MALTNENLISERPHLGGVQRVYRFANGFGLSLVNAAMLHSYPFAWEAAVLSGVDERGGFRSLAYDTGLSDNVEVFMSDEDANAFIQRARDHFAKSES